jgi:pimeloyl-ACP methyl ester carboxylesterase
MSVVEKHTISLHGHELVYRVAGEPEVAGSRPVLLLVHGMAGSSASWKAVLPRLGERYHVIAPDLPGHGESDKPRTDYSLGAYANTLRDLMIATGVPSATVVGHSLGGGVVMQLAYQHPQRCQRLVLVSSGGLGSEVSWLLRVFALPGTEYLMPLLFPGFVRDAGNAVSQALARFGFRWAKGEQEWRAYTSLTEPQNRQSFVRTLRAVIDPAGQAVSATDRLYLARHLPTMIVWGRDDTIIPVSHAEAAHEAIPGSRLEILDGVGHFPPAETPDRVIDLLTDFVDGTEPIELDDATWQAMLSEATARPPANAG